MGENMTKKSEQWLNEKIEAQSEMSLLEKPLFLSHEVYYKVEPAVDFAKKLLSRPKPYGWGKKKKSKNGTDTVNGTAETNGTETGTEEEDTVKIDVEEDGEAKDDGESADDTDTDAEKE